MIYNNIISQQNDIKEWLSYHIHYNSDQRQLLTRAIGPLTQKLHERQLIYSWFFIRYWEQGSHIRFRVLANKSSEKEKIHEIIYHEIDRFLTRHPALIRYPDIYMPEEFSHWFRAEYGDERFKEKYGHLKKKTFLHEGRIPFETNNSIVSTFYEQELGRYGGEKGMRLAQELFHASSIECIKELSSPNGHDRNYIFGYAFKTILLSVLSVFSTKQALKFFERNFLYWTEFLEKSQGRLFRDLNEKYERQHIKLTNLTKTCLTKYPSMIQDQEIYLKTFKKTINNLKNGLETKVIHAPQHTSFEKDNANTLEQETGLASIILSYLHMHNNRLGITIHDEVYLNYLAGRALQDILSHE